MTTLFAPAATEPVMPRVFVAAAELFATARGVPFEVVVVMELVTRAEASRTHSATRLFLLAAGLLAPLGEQLLDEADALGDASLAQTVDTAIQTVEDIPGVPQSIKIMLLRTLFKLIFESEQKDRDYVAISHRYMCGVVGKYHAPASNPRILEELAEHDLASSAARSAET